MGESFGARAVANKACASRVKVLMMSFCRSPENPVQISWT